MSSFEQLLQGGHPNSLGNTITVVETVLTQPERFEEFYQCYFSTDPVVRLRVSNGMKRICSANSSLLVPYLDRFLSEISELDQASVQWTLAQLFDKLYPNLSEQQRHRATQILQRNLANNTDWIVLTQTMNTLSKWARGNAELQTWLIPQLRRLQKDARKSVRGRAEKVLIQLKQPL